MLPDLFHMVNLIQEQEREKLGHELHDGVSPQLAVAKLYLECVTARTELETIAINQIRTLLLSAVDSIRGISARLVISPKTNCSLVQLITELVRTINGAKSFTIDFEHSPGDRISGIDELAKLALYRIVQEQLNNIIKHSQANFVQIRLSLQKQVLRLVIGDDGIGFDMTKPAKGIGLMNIETRIRQLGGQVKIKSAPGEGCALDISLPL